MIYIVVIRNFADAAYLEKKAISTKLLKVFKFDRKFLYSLFFIKTTTLLFSILYVVYFNR